MPRNPHKTRCQMPGCRNWAMRGHTHCRSHRDSDLGPRGAGAPPGNLNALRTGRHTHPLTPDELGQLVHAILHAPEKLPHHLDLTIHSIHRRVQDPVKTLLALHSLVPTLLSRLADELFIAELHALRHQLPPTRQSQFEITVWRHALLFSPVRKLEFIHGLGHRLKLAAEEPAPGTPPPAPTRDEEEQLAPGRDGEDAAQR
jgi:hypothetical protein